jgi:hypothetical protein
MPAGKIFGFEDNVDGAAGGSLAVVLFLCRKKLISAKQSESGSQALFGDEGEHRLYDHDCFSTADVWLSPAEPR